MSNLDKDQQAINAVSGWSKKPDKDEIHLKYNGHGSRWQRVDDSNNTKVEHQTECDQPVQLSLFDKTQEFFCMRIPS